MLISTIHYYITNHFSTRRLMLPRFVKPTLTASTMLSAFKASVTVEKGFGRIERNVLMLTSARQIPVVQTPSVPTRQGASGVNAAPDSGDHHQQNNAKVKDASSIITSAFTHHVIPCFCIDLTFLQLNRI